MRRGKYIEAMRRHDVEAGPAVKGMTAKEIHLRSLRRAAILREIASLDLLVSDAVRLTGLSATSIYRIAKRHEIEFVQYGEKDTPLEAAVREAYAPGGIGPTRMARRLGKNPKTLMVVACRLHLAQPDRDTHRFRRGFEVPAGRRDEYRALKAAGCTNEEAGQIMGLIPRKLHVAPTISPRYSREEEARP